MPNPANEAVQNLCGEVQLDAVTFNSPTLTVSDKPDEPPTKPPKDPFDGRGQELLDGLAEWARSVAEWVDQWLPWIGPAVGLNCGQHQQP